MSSIATQQKRCTSCERKETRSEVRFCPYCGAVLPGLQQSRNHSTFFALLAEQLPTTPDPLVPAVPGYESTPTVDLSWNIAVAPKPILERSTRPAYVSLGRTKTALEWALFVLGPIGLIALFAGGIIVRRMWHTDYVLIAAITLTFVRFVLDTRKRLRE